MTSPPKPQRWGIFLHMLLALMVILLASGMLARGYYYPELIIHWRPQMLWPLLLLALAYGLRRQGRWVVVSLLLGVYAIWPQLALLPDRTIHTSSPVMEEITLVQWNMHTRPRDAASQRLLKDEVTALVSHSQPDILVLQEVKPAMAATINRALGKQFPYRIQHQPASSLGSMVLSRLPILNKHYLPLGFHQGASTSRSTNGPLVVSLKTKKQAIPFTLVELHAMAPISSIHAKQRNHELAAMVRVMTDLPTPNQLLVGDLNVTPWSPWYQALERPSGLSNAMQGRGVVGSWPSFLPFFLRIPIDHLLVSSNIEVLNRKLGDAASSDHLPVIWQLRLYN